jgi:hypothetical protein
MKSTSVIRTSVAGVLAIALVFSSQADADIPGETYKALGVSKSASPKEMYGKLRARRSYLY